jgi:hypothetical protein
MPAASLGKILRAYFCEGAIAESLFTRRSLQSAGKWRLQARHCLAAWQVSEKRLKFTGII